MRMRTLRWSAVALVAAAVVCTAGSAWGIGLILGETKEQLKLEYDVAVEDHGTGRVSITFTLADEGRLAPLDAVELVIPSKAKNPDGSYWMDLVVPIDMPKGDGGKRVGRVHLLRTLAERAEIQLKTHTMDGKMDPLTRLHHVIPVAKYLKKAPPRRAAAPAKAPPAEPPAASPPATEKAD